MDTNGNNEKENLVQLDPTVSFAMRLVPKPCTKKQLRYVADPRIEPFKTQGQTYYRYRRGTDKPVYLGTADFILKAVTLFRRNKVVYK